MAGGRDGIKEKESVDQSTGSTGPLNQGMERDGRSEEEGTGKGSAVRGSWEGLQCRGHPLAREADFSTRGSTFPFLRLIHFHFLSYKQLFS